MTPGVRRWCMVLGVLVFAAGVYKGTGGVMKVGLACIIGAMVCEALAGGFGSAFKRLLALIVAAWVALLTAIALVRWCLANIGWLTVAAIFITASIHYGSFWAGAAACLAGGILVTSGWFALESARHPGLRPGAIITGVSRRRRIRRRWTDAALALELCSKGEDKRPMPLTNMRIIHNGLEALAVPGSVYRTPSLVYTKAPDLASSLFCDRVYVDNVNASTVKLTFQWGQHLKERRLWDMPAPSKPGYFVAGVRDDGEAAQFVANQSIMVGGATGAGKSNWAWAAIAGLIAAGIPFRLRIIDPQGTEFYALSQQLARGGMVHDYIGLDALDPTKLKAFFGRVDRAMEARLVDMQGARMHEWSAAEPLDVTICDETLLLAPVLRKEGIASTAGRIAFGGRKCNFVMWFLTQMAQKETIGELRSVINQRVCLRTLGRQETEVVLREGAERDGAPCSLLNIEYDRGVSYAMQPDVRGYRAQRAPLVTDTDAALIAVGRLPDDPVAQALELDRRPCAVYRFFNDGEVEPGVRILLYIGKAVDPDARERQHARESEWYQYATSRDTEWYPSVPEALEQEASAIKRENPRYNKQHNDEGPRPIVPALPVGLAPVPRTRLFSGLRRYRTQEVDPPMPDESEPVDEMEGT